MTDRIERVREYENSIFDGIKDVGERRAAYIHS
jgi:hypothetical protein